jgi:hypothetical protein
VNSIGDPYSTRGGARHQARALMAVTRELRRVVRTLRQLARAAPETVGHRGPRDIKAADVRAIIATRRLRETCLGPGIADPAWALLLEAYAARLDGRRIPINGFGTADGMARSTVQRWTRVLIARGLLSGEAPAADRRVSLIGLSDEGEKRMRACLAGAARLSPWMI